MDRLIEFFARNPVLLLVAVVWLAGLLGNVAKAAKQARERAAQRPSSLPSPQPDRPVPVATQRPLPTGGGVSMGERDAEAVAREMRRILGLEPAAGDARAGRGEAATGDRRERAEALRPAPQPTPRPAPRPIVRAELPSLRRDAAAPEKPPAPVQPSTGRRRLDIHVDPHVGESIGKRSRVGSGKVGEHALGELGGRTHASAASAIRGSRYELDDLKRAFVLSEILGPPLASRPDRREP